MERFRAKLEPVPHGGQFVVVPARIASSAGLKYADRVRGTVNGAGYRSSLMKYSGVFHMGVHKATLAAAGVKSGARVEITIELDDEPLPTDVVPSDLEQAIAAHAGTCAAWAKLSPAHKREHVKQVIEAKKPETRARRIAVTVAALRASKR
jgi:bifunctional DNA-binding transcriptional regulator/antitoxin component of YhaV-PrlF toxin-antitoxin module